MPNDALPIQPPSLLPPLLAQPHPPSVWAAVGLVGLYLALQAAFAGAVLGAVALIQHAGHATDMVTPAGHGMTSVLRQPGTLAAATIASVCCAALLVVWLVYRRWPRLWARAAPPGFGVTPPTHLRWLIAALLVGGLLPLLGSVLTQLLAHGHEIPQDIEQLTRNAPLVWRIVLAAMAISLGPLVEELLFRGMLLSALLSRCGTPLAAILSAAGFATIHLPGLQWQWYALPQLILLGVALVWLRLRYRSLWPAVVAHGTHNALALTAWFFALTPPG
jgi:membrane protease YdiL (CAAX protease family)